MRHRRLGRTGLDVSEIGFGGIPIQTIGMSDAVKVVTKALDLRINFIDTARAYTDSEAKIGKAIIGRRDDCIIATKSAGRTAADVEKDVKVSLSNLGVDRVDLYQLHNVSSDETYDKVMEPDGPLDALKTARKERKVDFIGVTSHRPSILIKAINSGEFDAVMVPLNYVEKGATDELIPLANKRNVGTIIMKPLGGGAFSNSVEALKFVLNCPISTVIPGMSSIQEVEVNARVGRRPITLSPSEKRLLSRQASKLGKTFCRACEYCQPCPTGIPISILTRLDTFVKRMGFESWRLRWSYSLQRYEECNNCRQCEEKCPYHLPILQLMKKKVAWLRSTYAKELKELEGRPLLAKH